MATLVGGSQSVLPGVQEPRLRLIKQKVRTSFNNGSGENKTFSRHDYGSSRNNNEEYQEEGDFRRSEIAYHDNHTQHPQPPTKPRRHGEPRSPVNFRSHIDGPTVSDISRSGRKSDNGSGNGDNSSSKRHSSAGNAIVSAAAAIGNESALPDVRRRRPSAQYINDDNVRRESGYVGGLDIDSAMSKKYPAEMHPAMADASSSSRRIRTKRPSASANGSGSSSSSNTGGPPENDRYDSRTSAQSIHSIGASSSSSSSGSSGRHSSRHSGHNSIHVLDKSNHMATTAAVAGAGGPSSDLDLNNVTLSEVGLDNLGNTCFMNSALQCLLHVQPLVAFFLTPGQVDNGLNLASPKKGVLASSFLQLVRDMHNKRSGSSVSPVHLHRAVSKYAPYLMDYQQQDSQEFLRFLLDGMSEDLCRKHSVEENAELDGQKQQSNTNDLSNRSSGSAESPQYNPDTQPSPTEKNTLGNNNNDSSSRSRAANNSMLPSLQGTAASSATQNDAAGSVKDRKVSAAQRLRNETKAWHDVPPVSDSSSSSSSSSSSVNSSGNDNATLSPQQQQHQQQQQQQQQQQNPGPGSGSKAAARLHGEIQRSCLLETSVEHNSNSNNNNESGEDSSSSEQDDVEYRATTASAVTTDSEIPVLRTSATAPSTAVASSLVDEASGSIRNTMHLQQPRNTHDGIHSSSNNDNESKEPQSVHKQAAISWSKYLKLNDSIITDIFAGQLQSTVECMTCHHRSSTFDPFLDLSVPISHGGDNGTKRSFLGSFRSSPRSGGAGDKITLETCLGKFTAEETLDGDNMYTCEKCKKKKKCVKRLSIYKYPKVLVIHIKRFRFSTTRREKLSTDVNIPLSDLDLSSFVSADLDMQSQHRPVYDLIAVCNHHGSLHAGHYIAHVDVSAAQANNSSYISATGISGGSNGSSNNISSSSSSSSSGKGGGSRWLCFNDSRVSAANSTNAAGPSAYVLFYKLRE